MDMMTTGSYPGRTATLRSVAVALLTGTALASCTTDTTSSTESVEGTWVESAPGTSELVLEDSGELHGTDGCNQLSGQWVPDGGTVIFDQVAITMRACPDMDTWLGGLSSATVDGELMYVLDESGTEIGMLGR